MSKQPLSEPVAERERATELCPDCGRAPVAEGYSRSHSRCDAVLGDGECDRLTIAKLRAELAAVEKLNAAECRFVTAGMAYMAGKVGDTTLGDAFADAYEALRDEVKNG